MKWPYLVLLAGYKNPYFKLGTRKLYVDIPNEYYTQYVDWFWMLCRVSDIRNYSREQVISLAVQEAQRINREVA